MWLSHSHLLSDWVFEHPLWPIPQLFIAFEQFMISEYIPLGFSALIWIATFNHQNDRDYLDATETHLESFTYSKQSGSLNTYIIEPLTRLFASSN